MENLSKPVKISGTSVRYFIYKCCFVCVYSLKKKKVICASELLCHPAPKNSHRGNRALSNVSQAVILLSFVFFCFLGIWLLSTENGKNCDLEH